MRYGKNRRETEPKTSESKDFSCISKGCLGSYWYVGAFPFAHLLPSLKFLPKTLITDIYDGAFMWK